jgi:dihydrofolate reductase
MIKMIAAIDRNLGLGRDNQLLFRIPADLQRFKQLTLGHTVLMGRKTFESIGRPLPGRHNIVLSRKSCSTMNHHVSTEHFTSQTSLEFISDIETLLTPEPEREPHREPSRELFIIGGAQIYEFFLPYADELLLTRVEQSFDADCFFPDWQRAAQTHGYQWTLIESLTGLTYANLDYGFYRYLKVK